VYNSDNFLYFGYKISDAGNVELEYCELCSKSLQFTIDTTVVFDQNLLYADWANTAIVKTGF
jgi:hypothetical protein